MDLLRPDFESPRRGDSRASLAVLVVVGLLLGLLSTFGGSILPAGAQAPSATITLDKTVGTNPATCAATDAITVTAGTAVTYCYTVTNTGNTTLTTHDLVDDRLGPLLSGFGYFLPPLGSAFLTATATLNTTTVNVATWTAGLVIEGATTITGTAVATDTATVTVIAPPPPPPPPLPPEICQNQPVTVDLARGQSPTNGPDVIRGTTGDDIINALGGDDIICSLGGDDIVSGNQGNDRAFGAGGDDEMRGNSGDDILRGRAGDDLLYGQAGNDTLDGGPDTDTCRGGTGTDTATACETTVGVP